MIDKRKQSWDYPKELHRFIELVENDGFCVTYVKQNISKSWLKIQKDEIVMDKFDFDHLIGSGADYYKLFKNTLWPIHVKYHKIMNSEQEDDS
jgi:hypothetical protein